MPELNDWLRVRDSGLEGQVVAVDGDQITLRMNLGGEETHPAGELERNAWDVDPDTAPGPESPVALRAELDQLRAVLDAVVSDMLGDLE